VALAAAGCATATPGSHAASPAANVRASTASPSSAAPGSSATARTSATAPAVAPGTAVKSASALTPPLNLPKIPWAGGSAYWAKFPAAAAWGWTKPSFFPINVWDAVVTSPLDAAREKAAGVNTYLNLGPGNDLAAIRAAHQSVVGDAPKNLQPEIVGYDLTDEPDGWAGAGSGPINTQRLNCSTSTPCGFTLMAHLDATVPVNSGRFSFTNYTSGVITNPSVGRRFLNDYQSVASMDSYFYTATDSACYVSKVYGVLKSGECPKAADYGHDVALERAIDRHMPLWNYVELGTTVKSGDNITPGEVGGAVWSSVISGAMGINYFIEDTANGPCGKVDNVIEDTSCPQAVAVTKEVTKVDGQIRALAKVLNTQSYRHSFNSRLQTMLKWYDGSYYIFALPGLRGGAGTYTLKLPAGLNATQIQVLGGEDRTIPVKNGAFSDQFAHEYSYHLYKVVS
jgi:hypothetical protein